MTERQKYLHEDLVDRCLQGDRTAYEKLYKLYNKAMYNICYRITNNEDDAADILQEAFVSAFSNLDTYRRNATFGAWLKRIVVNKAINYIKLKRIELTPMIDGEHELAEDNDMPEGNVSLEKIRKAIELLPDGYRVVFSLYLLEGYDHAEIAEIMGISESTSKSQYNRSKKKLREILTTLL